MTEIALDHRKMLGFRLLSTDEVSGDAIVTGAKSGKTMVANAGQDVLASTMSISAKFGKEGKIENIESAVALSSKFGKIGKVGG